MKEIQLTQGQVALVDDEDFERVSQYKWRAQKDYTIKRLKFYAVTGRYPQVILMHRLIIGAEQGQSVDHISGNPLDNTRNNLRFATPSQNSCNTISVLVESNRSGFRGVSFYKPYKKWRAQICVMTRVVTLGYFTDKLEAAKAYNQAAIKYHGEFATLNPIEGDE